MRPLGLPGFDARFRGDPDPWSTFTDADERLKRAAVLHALGPGPHGRVWEPASGAGATSAALASRVLRLDATDGAPAAVELSAAAVRGRRGARASRVALPNAPPRPTYDAVVVAEVLYYLSPRDMARTARRAARALRPGGRLVLAHHRIDFHDFAQHAHGVHARFLAGTGARWRGRTVMRNRRWIVQAFVKLGGPGPGPGSGLGLDAAPGPQTERPAG